MRNKKASQQGLGTKSERDSGTWEGGSVGAGGVALSLREASLWVLPSGPRQEQK